MVQAERARGYPPALIALGVAIRAGVVTIKTQCGRTRKVFVEQGLGQGRVCAPSDSNRLAAATLWALLRASSSHLTLLAQPCIRGGPPAGNRAAAAPARLIQLAWR